MESEDTSEQRKVYHVSRGAAAHLLAMPFLARPILSDRYFPASPHLVHECNLGLSNFSADVSQNRELDSYDAAATS